MYQEGRVHEQVELPKKLEQERLRAEAREASEGTSSRVGGGRPGVRP
jgi:hypothetical protein